MKVTILLELERDSVKEGADQYQYRPTEVWHNGREIKGEATLRTMALPSIVFDNPKEPSPTLTVVIMED